MFGWTKREKNEKSRNRANVELNKMTPKEKGAKLSRLRKRYPNRVRRSVWDFNDRIFDPEMMLLYLLIFDDSVVNEADIYDNPVEEPVEVSVAAEAVEEVIKEAVEEVSETESFDSSTPIESTPTESTPKTTSFDSDTDTSSYGGGGDSCDSGSSHDSGDSGGGGCGDCGGCGGD